MGSDERERCLGCMEFLAWDGRCSCGFDRKTYSSDLHHLPLGSFLKNGDYMVGRVLDEGGFGITYIGFDQNLRSKIAIKEYYPAGFAGRDISKGTYDVYAYGGDAAEVYKKGLEAFLKEARILTQFSATEGIVKARNLFEENNTAYIVMEYVEGVSIKYYVQRYGRIKPELALKMMERPIRALQAVHEKNLVHRDVSADNLMIGNDGKVTLIDFGAARFSNALDERTRTTICKQGFSALEQYSRDGKQGAWTDVYGICATMYYMLTGFVPKNSTERIVDDTLVPLSQMDDILLGQDKKEAIMAGMAVKSSERFQNMGALYSALYGKLSEGGSETAFALAEKENMSVLVEQKDSDRKMNGITGLLREALQDLQGKKEHRKRKKFWGKIAGGAVAAVLLALILWNQRGFIYTNADVGQSAGHTGKERLELQMGAKPTDTPEPSKGMKNRPINSVSGTSGVSDEEQTPPAVSTPQAPALKMVKMPGVAGMKREEAVKKLKKKGLRCKIVLRNSNKAIMGTVIRADVSAGKTVKKGRQIILYVSKGKRVTVTPEPTAVPRPTVAPKPTVTKKPKDKQDDNLAGDLDTILQ